MKPDLSNGFGDPGGGSELLLSLSKPEQLLEIERIRITDARLWAMRKATLSRPDLLTEGFCRELHRRMFQGIWRGAGRYRTRESSPGWEVSRIPEAVGMFVDDAEGWIRFSTYSVQESAVRLHQRMASVRPWAVGNGRHARLLADIVVAAHGEKPLAWGLGLDGEVARERYRTAMASAEQGNLAPLLAFALSEAGSV
jgi:Fic-DOC domain mobile mystery protein B